MVNDRYIWCRTCGAIHHVTPSDRAPIYTRRGDELFEHVKNDWQEFMDRHSGHRLEPMLASHRGFCPEGPSFDPMSVRYLEISNGRDTLLVQRLRTSVEEPFQYSLVDGRLVETETRLGIQASTIRREMKRHFDWAPGPALSDEKIDHFLALFLEIVSSLSPEHVRETVYLDADENVGYCAMDDSTVAQLLTKCTGSFHCSELEALRRFIETHRQADDVLALVKRREMRVAPISERITS